MRPLPATHLLDVHGCRTGVEILSAHGAFFTPRDPSKHNSLHVVELAPIESN